MRRAILAFFLMALGVGLLSGCGSSTGTAAGQATTPSEATQVKDLLGRTVVVPKTVDKIVAIGPGTLRLVCYAQAADKVVGIENLETRKPIQRPYLFANPSLLNLPVIGPGGPDSTPDSERLIKAAPDVIFASQLLDETSADELQKATGIPVVVLSYGTLGTFGEELFTSLDLLGKVLGKSERTTEVTSFIKSILADLKTRTASVPEADRPSAYVGALGFKGAHGIESTDPDYPPFAVIGAKNVTAGLPSKGGLMVDKEKLLVWNPRYIFLDRSGLNLVKEDVGKNRAFYRDLTAVKEKRVFTQLPFNNYSTNIETALGNAYYVGSVMYPQQFSDITITAKFDEISDTMLGAPSYQKLTEMYKGSLGPFDPLAASK
jgi:iron complex transport system substrate-binding protein